MTVYNNMAFGLKLRKYPKPEIEQRVREAAGILGIEELLERKPKALSGGQRQRVAVGRAIVRKPKVFLFDEPLSNLDAKLRVEMRAELNKLHRRLETTMVYVTHDQVEAMTLGDRIAVMKDGTLQQVAPPLEIYDRPANQFVAGFIGTPPMNFLDGALVAQDGAVWFDEGSARLRLPASFAPTLTARVGQKAVLGVRPETLTALPGGTGPADGNALRVKINVVEPLGDEMLLYLSTPKHDLIAKMDAHQRAEVGQEMTVAVQVARSHVFDPATGVNLTASPATARP
jgi:multiple sugar transport system ATP-binding protein